ncbi:Heat shock protein 12A [Mycena venus]|uniref:Heat shock protein 12A n=1 Tax=Mycena venus TaxID=2733690 RepID=A0A8H6U4K2_9AGAR|nr:Heat shock protein 12A [Mycena venus]
MAVNRIPFEIWLRISDLVGPEHSSSLYSVNRTWFTIAMDLRYKDLDLSRPDEKLLSRLDPGIAKHVGHLSVSGLALQYSLLDTIAGQKIKFPVDKIMLNPRTCASDVLNTRIRLISEVISAATNVSEYSVKWNFREEIQSGDLIHALLQGAVLDVAWRAFGSTLRKLHVSTRPERLNAVLASEAQLEHLQEIHLELLHPSNGVQSIGIQDIFPDHVSSFFSRVNPHLDSLSIQSSSNLDLSSVFHQLPLFRNLKRLSLHIFLDHGVLSELESFFAHTALKLRHLTLSLYHAAVSSVERVLPTLAMSRACLPSLVTLEINFGLPHPELADTLLRELHDVFSGASSTLRTLILEGIALSHADLKSVTSTFADRDVGDPLQSLTVSVLTLTAAHIDTLAENVPRLSALGIIFMYLSREPDGQPGGAECRELFKTAIAERRGYYPAWKLAEISIWHKSRSVDSSRWDLVLPFPACIPTISTFFGHPIPVSQPGSVPAGMVAALTQG